MSLNIIVDVSGSMTENGKDSVVRYLLYAIEGYCKEEKGVDYKVFQWGRQLEELTSPYKLSFDSEKSSNELIEFLNNCLNDKTIIVSDGGLSREIKLGIKEISNRSNIYYLGVGSDFDLATIRTVTKPDRIFFAQEVISCMRSITNMGEPECS